jgi:hypothetical protein
VYLLQPIFCIGDTLPKCEMKKKKLKKLKESDFGGFWSLEVRGKKKVKIAQDPSIYVVFSV